MTWLEVLSEVRDPIYCKDMSISLSYDLVDPYEERPAQDSFDLFSRDMVCRCFS
jgi:hypothetical protein